MARIQQDVTLGGRYRLVHRIAAGGMGTVWAAEDQVLHRRVAVKLLSEALGSDPQFVERFRREARAAAGLSHPNIAGVFDYGEDAGTPYIVMELVDGETLAHRLAREGPLEPAAAAAIAADVADALQAAHDAGVVHRDVKPGNVMLDERGRVRVMDFGIAAASGAAPITATGTTLGTATYLSPEQAAGERATPASDVYGLGCVLYEMLTGRPPFVGDSPVAVATAHAQEALTPVRELAPHVPPELAGAVETALAKDPSARPSSAATFGSTLRGAEGGPAAQTQADTIAVAPPAATAVLPTPAATHTAVLESERPRRPVAGWVWLVGAAVVVAGAVALLVASLVGGGGTPLTPAGSPSPSAAASSTITVPNVVGDPLDEALRKLAAAGFDHVTVKSTEKAGPGIVGDVNPDEGSTVDPSKTVTLLVGEPGGAPKGKGHDKDGKGHD